jgi:phage baseplate assembly protein gpV
MDQRERINDFEEALRAALDGFSSGLWVALPGTINSFDATKQTASVQPVIRMKRQQQDGTIIDETMPLCLDCPVIFPSGGGYSLTFPLVAGDECLILFADRCIDSWWQSGGIQVQAELRLHDLSDGFVLAGPRSQPRKLGNYSTTATELRSDDGTLSVSVNQGTGVVTVKAPTKIRLESPLTELTGNLTVNGSVVATGEGIFNGGHTVSAHKHSGVQAGASLTGNATG